ncbi:hypothetical protein ACEN2J_06235 [Pseudorhodobacter sp. W20_MBD10_FR17]|uniref:hypothetical protein n=1 Tax=Pseudorhodobacter sp. W20_MBD10_FR17 TaxID=3240266 RepID=UPI003F9A5EA9
MTLFNAPRGARNTVQRVFHKSILLAAFVSGIASANAVLALDIRNDMGGVVSQRMAKVEQLRAAGTRVRILGTCVSACTLYLGLPNTCVSRTAKLGFHGPSTRLQGIPLPRQEFERVSRQMAAYYPSQIRGWFMSEARMRTGSYYTISGAQAIAMGARPCTEA